MVCFTRNRAQKDARNEDETKNRDPGKKNTSRPLHIDRVGDAQSREKGDAQSAEQRGLEQESGGEKGGGMGSPPVTWRKSYDPGVLKGSRIQIRTR